MTLTVLVERQLAIDNQATAVAAHITTLLESNTLDQTAAEEGLKALLRHAQSLNAALQATLGHIAAMTVLPKSADRSTLGESKPLLLASTQPAAAQGAS